MPTYLSTRLDTKCHTKEGHCPTAHLASLRPSFSLLERKKVDLPQGIQITGLSWEERKGC